MNRKIVVFVIALMSVFFAHAQKSETQPQIKDFTITCTDSSGQIGYMIWQDNGKSLVPVKVEYALTMEGVPISPAPEDLEEIYDLVTKKVGEQNMTELLVKEVFIVEGEGSLQISFEFYLPEKGDFHSGIFGIQKD